jgi:glycosyltransferase involved in cell wall biosynthesis
MSAVKVALIIDHLGLGGQQTQLCAVLPALRAHGFAPTVLSLRRPTELSRGLEAAGVPVISLGLPRWSPTQLPALTRELRRLRPAIAHTTLTVGNLVGRVAALRAGVPALVMEEQLSLSQDLYSTPAPIVLAARLAERWLAPRTACFLGPSHAVQAASAAAKGWPAERCTILPNAVDCQRFTPPLSRSAARAALGLPDRPTVATFGRLVAQKRIGDVLTIARTMASALPAVQFIIAGAGPLETELRRSIADQGLASRVLLLGRRADSERLLAASDIYLSASGGEVLSVAILEALAAGCPVVATSAGGTAEQVAHGVTGYLAPVGDIDGLSAALRRLLTDPVERARFGAAARRAALATYDLPAVVAQLAAIYAGLLPIALPAGVAVQMS